MASSRRSLFQETTNSSHLIRATISGETNAVWFGNSPLTSLKVEKSLRPMNCRPYCGAAASLGADKRRKAIKNVGMQLSDMLEPGSETSRGWQDVAQRQRPGEGNQT